MIDITLCCYTVDGGRFAPVQARDRPWRDGLAICDCSKVAELAGVARKWRAVDVVTGARVAAGFDEADALDRATARLKTLADEAELSVQQLLERARLDWSAAHGH
jgi:hypothetical protein